MKALIYKELKLAMHPVCYVFIFMFPLMVLIPSYPMAVGFIYVLTCYPIIFLGANKGQQSNDLLYSVLLPVRKKDIVLARIITVVLIQTVFTLLMAALLPFAKAIQEAVVIQSGNPELYEIAGFGFDSFVLVIAIVTIGFALADLIFFPIYYKKGRSIVMSTLLTIFGFVIYICLFTIALPYIPSFAFLKELSLGIQFAVLAVALGISYAIHTLVYKTSSKLLENVDF